MLQSFITHALLVISPVVPSMVAPSIVTPSIVTPSIVTPSVFVIDARAQTPCWAPPVTGTISDPFREPNCPWCSGNRGIEYDTDRGEVVRAVAPGVVTFAGSVAGTQYVVVEHLDGVRATYGGLDVIGVEVGAQVIARMGVGLSGQRTHFGLRRGEDYVDPTPLLGEWTWRARLIPDGGESPRPAGSATLRCSADH